MKRPPALVQFIPFDPTKKLSEATITSGDGKSVRIVKARSTQSSLGKPSVPGSAAVKELEKQGFRVLAVAEGRLAVR